LGESSQKKERQLLVKPCEFFQQKCLSKITPEDVLRFREWRSESGVGPALINMEVGVIRRMLKRARRWHLLGADIRPLKEPRSIGRALTYDEKLRLLRTAGLNEDWQRAEAAISLALCTTMRGCEIKQLQWRDIDFLDRTILVRTSKTEAGQRLIPMNEEVHEIVMRLRERAKGFNGIESTHYVFPSRRQAVAALSARPTGSWFGAGKGTGFDTNNDTEQDATEKPAPEVIENMVGPWGLEPQTSTVSR